MAKWWIATCVSSKWMLISPVSSLTTAVCIFLLLSVCVCTFVSFSRQHDSLIDKPWPPADCCRKLKDLPILGTDSCSTCTEVLNLNPGPGKAGIRPAAGPVLNSGRLIYFLPDPVNTRERRALSAPWPLWVNISRQFVGLLNSLSSWGCTDAQCTAWDLAHI